MIWQAGIVTDFGWLLQVASSVANSDNDIQVKTCFTLADLFSPPTGIISQSEDNNHLFLLGLCIMQVTNSVNEPRGNDSQVKIYFLVALIHFECFVLDFSHNIVTPSPKLTRNDKCGGYFLACLSPVVVPFKS